MEAAIFALVAPGFFSIANVVNIALSIAVTGMLAVGMTAVMVTGGIDLGVGSVVALTGVAAAMATAADRRGAGACRSPWRCSSACSPASSTAR